MRFSVPNLILEHTKRLSLQLGAQKLFSVASVLLEGCEVVLPATKGAEAVQYDKPHPEVHEAIVAAAGK